MPLSKKYQLLLDSLAEYVSELEAYRITDSESGNGLRTPGTSQLPHTCSYSRSKETG